MRNVHDAVIVVLGIELGWIEIGAISFLTLTFLGAVGAKVYFVRRQRREARLIQQARKSLERNDLPGARAAAREAEQTWWEGDGDRLAQAERIDRLDETLEFLLRSSPDENDRQAIEAAQRAGRELCQFLKCADHYWSGGIRPQVVHEYLAKYDAWNASRIAVRAAMKDG